MEKWFISDRLADFSGLSKELGVSEVLVRLMVNRGLTTAEEMRKYLSDDIRYIYDSKLLKGAKQAALLILDRLHSGKKIRIVGDYDVDGVISTYLLYTAFTKFSDNVDYEIPDRVNDGYGINISIIDQAIRDGVNVIVTCDNGIAAIEQTLYAKANGIEMIITDHHALVFDIDEQTGKPVYSIPQADVVVNPNLPDDEYPFKDICGASVAYKVIGAMYELEKVSQEEYDELLGYVAIATICDVVSLTDENRIIVKRGLKYLNKTTNVGLLALKHECAIDTICAYQVGFVIGPCINASGRLESAKLAIALLLEKDVNKAEESARYLKELNDERKTMTENSVRNACELLDDMRARNELSKVIVVYLEECHESIAGIIAGRLRDRYYRPVFVVTKGNGICKGSGRSIDKYNMANKLNEVKHLLTKFGGHSMAAGFSLDENKIADFERELNERCELTQDDMYEKISIDIELPIGMLNEKILGELECIEPHGKNNDKPKFAQRDLTIIKASRFGKTGNMLKLKVVSKQGHKMEAKYFGDAEKFDEYIIEHFGRGQFENMYNGYNSEVMISAIYYPKINEYRGLRSIEMIISNYR